NSIVAVNKDENITAQKLAKLNNLLTDATAQRIQAEKRYERALENSGGAGFDDSSTQTVRSDLAKFKAEYSLLSEKFTDQYPRMKQLKSQIEELERSVSGQRMEIIEGLKAKAEASAAEEKNLKEELDKQTSKAFELSKKQVQYNILNRELETSRELLQNVLKQSKETSLSVESNASNVSIVDYAIVPSSPSYPRKKVFLLVGAFLGAVFGLGAAFTLRLLDNSIRTPDDVENALALPSLGIVPSFELEQKLSSKTSNGSVPKQLTQSGNKSEPEDKDVKNKFNEDSKSLLAEVEEDASDSKIVFVSNPTSLAAEAYRTIRTGILLSNAGEPPKTILVTSAQSSEGKTTSSINLAASLASAGAKVVLVDADLRRPSVHNHFTFNLNSPGLVEVITGQLNKEEVYINDLIKRVTIFPGGSIPPNPAELLGSLEMASLIDELAADFDYVIIDSPPILPVTDSVILSRYVDGVVIVVRGGVTPRKIVKDAKNRLRSVQARLLGVIVNDVDVTGGDYYYYNRYYHSYYQTEDNNSEQKKMSS
ncbi:MAG: polysaccharide biosynthesis tyrosine autokinase, partial [Bdellovibrionales bacterium]|nr:polysaccharide biosynthesis tyrosine autokinase [Bdellovibrionales bacterium]